MNVPSKLYTPANEIAEQTYKRITDFNEGKQRPLVTSSRVYNEQMGGHIWGEQVGIVAQSGVGKTGFAIWLAEELVNATLNPLYKGKVILLYDSYEMTNVNMFLRSIAKSANLTTRELLAYGQRLKEEQLQAIREINARLGSLPIFYTDRPRTVKKWVEEKRHIQALNPEYYIINVTDHTRLFTSNKEPSERERMDDAMIEGKTLKNEFGMLNIFLSQVNNNIETSTDRKALGENLLVRSDIFGSSSLFQTCESVLTLQRPGMFDLSKWRGVSTGLSKKMAGDDNLLVCQALKAREGNLGVFLMKHNIKYYQFGDFEKEQEKVSKRVQIDLDDEE